MLTSLSVIKLIKASKIIRIISEMCTSESIFCILLKCKIKKQPSSIVKYIKNTVYGR